MPDRSYERYQKLNEEIWADREIIHLMERLRKAEPGYRDAMNALSPEHRRNMTEYLGTLREIYDRITEICSFLP